MQIEMPFKRFVRQVSNGGSFSKYGYIDLMQRNDAAICAAPWKEATCSPNDVTLAVGQMTRTDGQLDPDSGVWIKKPTYTAWLDDRLDCYKQGGDASSRMGTLCGYLGMVAYRFTLPTENPAALMSARIAVQRDRYLRSGVKINLYADTAETPSQGFGCGGWASSKSETAEGVTGVRSWGFLGQKGVSNLLGGRAANGFCDIANEDGSPIFIQSLMKSVKYLWVVMSIEDQADYWEMYSADEMRYYYIEGSAVLQPSLCGFDFGTTSVDNPDYNPDDPNGNEPTIEVDPVPPILPSVDRDADINLTMKDFPQFGADSAQKEAADSALGRLRTLMPVSALFVPHGDSRMIDVVPGVLRNCQSKQSFDHQDDSYLNTASLVDLRDMNALAPLHGPSSVQSVFAIYRGTEAKSLTIETKEVERDGATVVEQSAVRFGGVGALYLGYMFVPIPSLEGVVEYTSIDFSIPQWSTEKVAQHGMEADVNVWLSSSRDILGPFATAAVAALGSQPDFFTAAKSAVSGSVSGDGACTSGISVSASASLIGRFSVADLIANGGKCSIGSVSVRPGEVILLSPNVKRMFMEDEWSSSRVDENGVQRHSVVGYLGPQNRQNIAGGWVPYTFENFRDLSLGAFSDSDLGLRFRLTFNA